MTIGFTICSNNYLAHAKTVGDSFLKHHPDSKFIIGLVDKFDPQFDYSLFSSFEFLPIETLQLAEFEMLLTKYDITELNTSVKPSYFIYLFNKYPVDKVIYLDPDILVTNPFDEVLHLLDTTNIVLTPHMLTPIDDGCTLSDSQILPNGIFNLGFLALSDFKKVQTFLIWWHQRLMKYCFRRVSRGQFYDQFWINYVPSFYDNYAILRHPGYNMANWNLHERILSQDKKGDFIVNKNFQLCFFHFSGYRYKEPESIASYSNRYTLQQRPDLRELFAQYNTLLKENKVDEISKLPVFYFPNLGQPKPKHKYSLKKLTRRLDKVVGGLFH